LAIFLITFAGIIFGTYLVTPLWKATAKVRVQYNPKQQLTMFEGITTPGTVVSGINPANDVIQILTSRELAEKVVKKFERDKLWEKRTNAPESTREIIKWYIKDFLIGKPVRFLQGLGILSEEPDNYLAMAVGEFQKDLEDIALEENTTVVNVSVWGESPQIATAMTNTLVQLLLEKNLEASRAPIDEIIKSTQEQLARAKRDLKVAQENLRRFKEESGLILYDEEAAILLQRLDKYEAELNSIKSQVRSLRVEKSAEHPEVKSLLARINEYRNIIIPQIQQDLMNLPLKEVELARLNQELEVREDLYSTLKQKLLELEVLKNSSLGDLELKVIDPARVYSYVHPDWPRWVINIPLGFVGSIFVSLIFVFFVEYWNSSFKSVKELEEDINMPVLSAVPKLGYFKRKKLAYSFMSSKSKNYGSNMPVKQIERKRIGPLDQYDLLADAILLKKKTHNGKRFLITSPGQGEGKSTITTMLGQILTMRGKKVLIIEANLRTPSLERMLKVKGNKGLLEYYIGDSELQDLIVNINGIDVIFAGNLSAHYVDPFEILTSHKMETLLQDLKTRYDFILIDSPCIKRFKDSLGLTALSDGVILIVEANQTPRRAILMAIEKINTVGGQIKGIILNKQVNYVPQVIQNLISSL
jgi:tyrosine-protein kinase Etk/Wzc